jgi:predicted MFS family arabinose efflux permease
MRRLAIPGVNRAAALFLLHSAVLNIGFFGIADLLLNFYYVSLGYTSETIGVLQGVSRLGGFLTGMAAGMLTDRLGVRRITLYAVLLLAFTIALPVFLPTLPMLTASRILSGTLYGAAFIASNPFIMIMAEPHHRIRLFAYLNVLALGGTALGSVIGGHVPALMASLLLPTVPDQTAAAQSTTAYGASMVVAGAVIALSILPLVWLRLPHERPQETASATNGESPASMRIPWARLVWLSSPYFVYGITAGWTFPFYNLFFRETFGLPDQDVGTILSVGALGMGLITLVLPFLDRRLGGVRTLAGSMLVAALAFLLLSGTPVLPLSIGLFVVAVSVRNMMTPIFNPMVLGRLPGAFHSSISSLSTVLWSLGWFIATPLGGLWQRDFGFPFILQMVALGLLVTAVNVMAVFRMRH